MALKVCKCTNLLKKRIYMRAQLFFGARFFFDTQYLVKHLTNRKTARAILTSKATDDGEHDSRTP